MRAAVYKGERVLEVEEIATPTAGPGEVVVRVRYCAVCGTDVHAFMYDVAPPGTVMGHEYCGTVTEVGEGVTRWQVGDRVVGGGGNPPPGYVATGPRTDPRYNYRTMGFPEGAKTRAYAEYVLLDDWEPVPIPDGVTDEEAALAEPCAVTVHAVRLSENQAGRPGAGDGSWADRPVLHADGACGGGDDGDRVGACARKSGGGAAARC